MQDWNPELYMQFSAERTRPAQELVARIAARLNVKQAYDLGCGPGNSTELLRKAWPQANITGVDTSPAMLEKARRALPDCHFVEQDVLRWRPDGPADLIYANASLQWLPDHASLFPRLASLLAPQGVLAAQMPDNWQEPTHAAMRTVAKAMGMTVKEREPLLAVEAYYDLLSQAGCELDIWRTTYFHLMPSVDAIVEWLRATGLRPFLDALDETGQQHFLDRYRLLLSQHYLPRGDGRLLLAFPRLFIVAHKK